MAEILAFTYLMCLISFFFKLRNNYYIALSAYLCKIFVVWQIFVPINFCYDIVKYSKNVVGFPYTF